MQKDQTPTPKAETILTNNTRDGHILLLSTPWEGYGVSHARPSKLQAVPSTWPTGAGWIPYRAQRPASQVHRSPPTACHRQGKPFSGSGFPSTHKHDGLAILKMFVKSRSRTQWVATSLINACCWLSVERIQHWMFAFYRPTMTLHQAQGHLNEHATNYDILCSRLPWCRVWMPQVKHCSR